PITRRSPSSSLFPYTTLFRSILFPGFTLTSACPAANQGLLTCEAAPGGTVTYTFTASSPGTRAYYSGTQGDLQVEMGLYGALIRSEEHTSELQSLAYLVCRLL